MSALFLFLFPMFTSHAENGEGDLVYVVPIEDNIEQGLHAFLERSIEQAYENGVDHIIFEIDTPGGTVAAADDIAQLLINLEIPNTAFVLSEAYSAGSYIALSADQIYMTPTSRMGASGVINSDGTAADKKAQSAWISSMTAAAEANGRDPIYAEAMANAEIDLPEYRAPKGEFLTLRATEALEVGYAEGLAEDRTELLSKLRLSEAKVEEIELTFAERIARFITDPVVVPILLSVASLGFIVELYSPGFGIPGIMGLLSLILFFYGHLIAGLAGMESIILLIIGIVCIVLEFFVPGGILGIVGALSVIVSLILAGGDISNMMMSVAIAIIVSIVASVILFRRIGLDKGVFRNIILKDATTTEMGYVSTVNRLELIGLTGRTLTPLRPAGSALFEQERLDVVSEGGYINQGKNVKIIKVEGSRIVVREEE
nr:nodulation protein NfeD [Salirhabdus sp. Marseille-P4669]